MVAPKRMAVVIILDMKDVCLRGLKLAFGSACTGCV